MEDRKIPHLQYCRKMGINDVEVQREVCKRRSNFGNLGTGVKGALGDSTDHVH